MATLYVSEFASSTPSGIGVPVGQQPPLIEQTVAITGASVQSNAFQVGTTFVRVHCDGVCSIEVGTNPTATTSTARMAANQTEYFGIPYNSGFRLAVILNN
jgi:hypothetical protein